MRRFGLMGPALAVSVVFGMSAAAAAVPSQLPEHAAAKVAGAQAKAAAAAEDFASDKARGQAGDKRTGLDRAAEVSSSWQFSGTDKPGSGNGRALGVGRSQAVHEALARGQSPSSLENHGEAVSAVSHEMRDAFERMKNKRDDHPGRGKSQSTDEDQAGTDRPDG